MAIKFVKKDVPTPFVPKHYIDTEGDWIGTFKGIDPVFNADGELTAAFLKTEEYPPQRLNFNFGPNFEFESLEEVFAYTNLWNQLEPSTLDSFDAMNQECVGKVFTFHTVKAVRKTFQNGKEVEETLTTQDGKIIYNWRF